MPVAWPDRVGNEALECSRLARAGRADRGDVHGFGLAAEGDTGQRDPAGKPCPQSPAPRARERAQPPASEMLALARPSREARRDRAADETERRPRPHPQRPVDGAEERASALTGTRVAVVVTCGGGRQLKKKHTQ